MRFRLQFQPRLLRFSIKDSGSHSFKSNTNRDSIIETRIWAVLKRNHSKSLWITTTVKDRRNHWNIIIWRKFRFLDYNIIQWLTWLWEKLLDATALTESKLLVFLTFQKNVSQKYLFSFLRLSKVKTAFFSLKNGDCKWSSWRAASSCTTTKLSDSRSLRVCPANECVSVLFSLM